MTRIEFCKQIVQAVDNCRSLDNMSDDEIAVVVSSIIAPLEPKDKKRFAKWGQSEHHSTPEDCW